MKNLTDVQNNIQDQNIINSTDLTSLKGGLGDPPPFGILRD